MKQYYPILIKHKLNTDYLIWYTDSEDGIICHESKLMKFTSLEKLQAYTAKNLIHLSENEEVIHTKKNLQEGLDIYKSN